LKRARSDYDEANVLGALARTRNVYSREEMARRPGGHGKPSPPPVFVFGMPRSGTTLVEQILASPLYQTSVGRWRNYEAFLGPLVAALGRADPRLRPRQ
jgi:Sulfotransferase family